MPKKTTQPKNKSTQTKSLMPKTLTSKIQVQLHEWAHAGTKEGLEKLEDFIVKEKNQDLRDYADIAYHEASYFYYSPQNDKQEKEFRLAKMIKERDDKLWKKISQVDSAKFELEQLELEKEIHTKVVKSAKKVQHKKNWPHNFSQNYYQIVKNRLQTIENEIAYQAAWLKQAKKMITTKKYQDIPEDIFNHIHFDGEGGSFWTDSWEGDENGCRITHDDDWPPDDHQYDDVPF